MSTLLGIRQDVVERSGRFELVADYEGADYTDNGANFFIQAGQRFLDLQQQTPDSRREFKVDLASGDYLKRISYLRAIEEVHVYDPGEDLRTKLTPKSLTKMKEEYLSFESTEMDNGTPAYYTNDVVNLAPSQNDYATVAAMETAVAGETAPFTYDYQNILADNTFVNRGVFFLPPADSVMTLTVTGLFFSKLESDTDYSYWSVSFPEVLLMATFLMMEAYHRNSAGMRDWIMALEPFLRGVDHDMVRSQMALTGNQREG